jgi:hypothetical protein
MQRLEVSGAVRPPYWLLGVKGLTIYERHTDQANPIPFVDLSQFIPHFCLWDRQMLICNAIPHHFTGVSCNV